MSASATGIMFSENLPEDLDIEKLEDFDTIDEGEFLDWIMVPGRFLMKCMGVKTQDDGNHKPSENIMFKVVGGAPAGQAGKAFMERIYHSAADRAIKLGKRMGVWTQDQHQAMLEAVRAGEPANGPDFSPCVGKEFVVVLKKDEYQGKENIKMDYLGIWQASDPRVADFVASISGSNGNSGNAVANSNAADKQSSKAEPVKEPVKSTSVTKRQTSKAKQPAETAAGVDEL